jgi:hypothetical protein
MTDLESVLNDPSVRELKRLALDLKAHPARLNAPSLSWAESWHSVWKSPPGQALQDKIRERFGQITLIPFGDNSLAVSSPGTAPSGYDGEGSTVKEGELDIPHSVSGIREFKRSMSRQNNELMSVVAARQKVSGRSFDECWREVLAERPDLKQGGSAGFLATPANW